MRAQRIRPAGAAVRAVATLLVGCLTATLVGQQSASGRPAPANGFFLAAQSDVAVAGTVAKPRAAVPDPAVADAAARTAMLPAPSWPAPSTVDVTLPATGPATPAPAGKNAPVALARVTSSAPADSAPSRLRVQTYDHAAAVAAGVNGLIIRVGRIDGAKTGGPARVSVDYSGFATAYGADWAARLRLVRLPSCATTSAAGAGCGPVTPLDSIDDTAAHTVTATVLASVQTGATGGTLIALAAGTQSGDGDYSATSLSPAATWSAGANSGDFTWTYPIRTPPATGGLTPSVTLGYSAQSVDGMMAASNNQPSWLGEGFGFRPGFIERSYRGHLQRPVGRLREPDRLPGRRLLAGAGLPGIRVDVDAVLSHLGRKGPPQPAGQALHVLRDARRHPRQDPVVPGSIRAGMHATADDPRAARLVLGLRERRAAVLSGPGRPSAVRQRLTGLRHPRLQPLRSQSPGRGSRPEQFRPAAHLRAAATRDHQPGAAQDQQPWGIRRQHHVHGIRRRRVQHLLGLRGGASGSRRERDGRDGLDLRTLRRLFGRLRRCQRRRVPARRPDGQGHDGNRSGRGEPVRRPVLRRHRRDDARGPWLR